MGFRRLYLNLYTEENEIKSSMSEEGFLLESAVAALCQSLIINMAEKQSA